MYGCYCITVIQLCAANLWPNFENFPFGPTVANRMSSVKNFPVLRTLRRIQSLRQLKNRQNQEENFFRDRNGRTFEDGTLLFRNFPVITNFCRRSVAVCELFTVPICSITEDIDNNSLRALSFYCWSIFGT